MPVFDLRCTYCQSVKRDILIPHGQKELPKCGCGGPLEKVWLAPPIVHTFTPYWEDNLDIKPVYVESKKQLKQEANKRGLTIPVLE